jgi:cyanate permease
MTRHALELLMQRAYPMSNGLNHTVKTNNRRYSQANMAIAASCFIAFVSFGFVASFGVFMTPMTSELGWNREVFALAVAVATVCWGVTQPVAGMLADRYGASRVIAFGAIMAALGFIIRSQVVDPTVFITTGVLVGIGTGACSFSLVIAAMGKIVEAKRRSFILGLGAASASAGMFVAAPLSLMFIQSYGWQWSMVLISMSFLLVLPALLVIAPLSKGSVSHASSDFSFALRTAFSDRSYLLLFFGFSVCGFHVSFIGTHLPAYIVDIGLSAEVGAWSLGLIGLFNIGGSLLSGWCGQVMSKKKMLAFIYAARAVAIFAFISFPVSPMMIYIFSAVMGMLWLATVPLTTGLIAQTQGIKFLATLSGMVFMSHQIGGFMGAWLGGRIYDLYQDYTPMWWWAIGFGVLAAVLHMGVNERPGKLASYKPG